MCHDPGCLFKGPGKEGACTQKAGILSYLEIRGILQENNIRDVPYDESAAVYYTTYNRGSDWISFDDAISFQAKIDLANNRGLGGLFIWAIDQDDRTFDALKAVTGRDVKVPPLATDGFGAFDINKCYITDCGANCSAGDTTMTHLNQDESSRGCDGSNHNQRSRESLVYVNSGWH